MNSYIIRNLPVDLHKQLKILAATNTTTINFLVIQAITEYLEKNPLPSK